MWSRLSYFETKLNAREFLIKFMIKEKEGLHGWQYIQRLGEKEEYSF